MQIRDDVADLAQTVGKRLTEHVDARIRSIALHDRAQRDIERSRDAPGPSSLFGRAGRPETLAAKVGFAAHVDDRASFRADRRCNVRLDGANLGTRRGQ